MKKNEPDPSPRNRRPSMAAVLSIATDFSPPIHLRPSQQSDTDRNPPHHSTTQSLAPHAPDEGQDGNRQKSISQILDASSGHRTREEKIQDSLET